jgi:glycosyltransferase involved in cell wall biosynthesis
MICTQWAKASVDNRYSKKYASILQQTAEELHHLQAAGTPISSAYSCTFQVRPPNEFEKITDHDIGVTAALETTFAPHEWIANCNMMKKILVVSEHSKKNLQNAKNPETGEIIRTPIEVIPFHNTQEEKISPFVGYENISTSINFLTVSQMAPRKNFYNLLKWFGEEFRDDENVGLVVKLHHVSNCTLDFYHTKTHLERILGECGLTDRKFKIHLIHGSLSPEEMNSLYDSSTIKGYVTTTHGEGFGVPLFNAVCADIPVIAPAWSGHMDYLSAPVTNEKSGKTKTKNLFLKTKFEIAPVKPKHLMPGLITESCEWCYADSDSFKKNLRNLIQSESMHRKNAALLGEHVRHKFSQEKVYRKYHQLLQDIPVINTGSPFNIEVDNMFKNLTTG